MERGDAFEVFVPTHRPKLFMKEIRPEPLLCVSVCEQRAGELKNATERALALAGIVELRLDCLPPAELQEALRVLEALKASTRKSFIITLRPAEQGGFGEIDSLNRIVFWLDRLGKENAHRELYDIELDVARVLQEKEGLDWSRVICSHHDFTGTAFDIDELYQKMKATSARFIKIAVRALDATDCIAVFKLLERACAEGQELIAVAMGEAGVMTRILGPARGSFLTYAALDERHATAPGQMTAEELRELYRIREISEETGVFGILGSPVAHSVSPAMHNAAFASSGMDAVYIPFEVRDVAGFMKRMVCAKTREIDLRLRGLSVTAPHKRSVMGHLDWIEPAAVEIGAVNTVVVEGENLRGYNTDVAAFLSTLEKRCVKLKGKRIAVIGAGGAARSVLWSLWNAGASATVFARDAEKASSLAHEFKAHAAESLQSARFHDYDVVVNATPVGTRGMSEDETPAMSEQLRGAQLVYDLVYNPQATRFLREARLAGCETLSGLEMLVAQAVEQFRLWTGTVAPSDVMLYAARKALKAEAS